MPLDGSRPLHQNRAFTTVSDKACDARQKPTSPVQALSGLWRRRGVPITGTKSRPNHGGSRGSVASNSPACHVCQRSPRKIPMLSSKIASPIAKGRPQVDGLRSRLTGRHIEAESLSGRKLTQPGLIHLRLIDNNLTCLAIRCDHAEPLGQVEKFNSSKCHSSVFLTTL